MIVTSFEVPGLSNNAELIQVETFLLKMGKYFDGNFKDRKFPMSHFMSSINLLFVISDRNLPVAREQEIPQLCNRKNKFWLHEGSSTTRRPISQIECSSFHSRAGDHVTQENSLFITARSFVLSRLNSTLVFAGKFLE